MLLNLRWKKKLKKEPVAEAVAVKAAEKMQAQAVISAQAEEEGALSPEELRAIIAQSKESEGDDCLMCGS